MEDSQRKFLRKIYRLPESLPVWLLLVIYGCAYTANQNFRASQETLLSIPLRSVPVHIILSYTLGWVHKV